MNDACRWMARALDALVHLFSLVTAVGLGLHGFYMTLTGWFVALPFTLMGIVILGLSAAFLWAGKERRRRTNGTLAGLFALPILVTALPGSGDTGIYVELYFATMVTLTLAATVLRRREEPYS